MRAVVFLVLFLIIVSVALHHDPLQSLLFAVALAVGLTPEFLPFTPLAQPMGFTPLPPQYFVFLALATVTYLFLVEIAKQRLMSSANGKNHVAARPRRPVG